MNIQTLQQMVGLTPQDAAEIELHRQAIEQRLGEIEQAMEAWAAEAIEELRESSRAEGPLVDEPFVRLLALGENGERFFSIVYRQALHWRHLGLKETSVMVVLSRLRQRFVELAEALDAPALARALCHSVDMAQAILTSVFQLSHALERFRERAEFEVKRVEHMFLMIEQEAPQTLVQAYRDHQRWKQLAYEMALGIMSEAHLETDPARCSLGQWLAQGGMELIPEDRREDFDRAHRRVHLLGEKLIREVRGGAPELALEMIWDIEAASDEVAGVLLELMDRIFVEVATQDALTGLPNRRSFERDYHKALKMARRYGLHMGLHLVDLDHFKRVNDTLGHLKGDEVLAVFAESLAAQLREDDHVYRWGGEEFAIITMHQEIGGAEQFARRLFSGLDGEAMARRSGVPWPLTVSMSTVEIPRDLPEVPADNRVFASADHLLYQAKEAGRNQLWAGRINERGYLREDTVHRVQCATD